MQFADLKGSLQLLTSTHLRDRDKMLLRAILCGGVWNGFILGEAKKEDVPCRFCGKRDGDGHLFWDCSFPLPPLQHVRELPEFAYLFIFCPLTAASGLGVFFGMVGCLVSVAKVFLTPGPRLLVIWLLFILSGA